MNLLHWLELARLWIVVHNAHLLVRELAYDLKLFLSLVIAINLELVEADRFKPLLRCLIWTIALQSLSNAVIVHVLRVYGLDIRDVLIVPAFVGAALLVLFFVLSRRQGYPE